MTLQMNQSGLPAPARLVCYWAVRELGMAATVVAVAGLFGITQQAVAKAFVQGEEFADAQRYKLISSEK
jgi:hypothetical protein